MRPKMETDLFIIALDEFAKENKKQMVTLDDMGEIVREMKLGVAKDDSNLSGVFSLEFNIQTNLVNPTLPRKSDYHHLSLF